MGRGWRGEGLARQAAHRVVPSAAEPRGAAASASRASPAARPVVGPGWAQVSPRAVLGQTGQPLKPGRHMRGSDDGGARRTCLRSAWLVGSSSASSTSE